MSISLIFVVVAIASFAAGFLSHAAVTAVIAKAKAKAQAEAQALKASAVKGIEKLGCSTE